MAKIRYIISDLRLDPAKIVAIETINHEPPEPDTPEDLVTHEVMNTTPVDADGKIIAPGGTYLITVQSDIGEVGDEINPETGLPL